MVVVVFYLVRYPMTEQGYVYPGQARVTENNEGRWERGERKEKEKNERWGEETGGNKSSGGREEEERLEKFGGERERRGRGLSILDVKTETRRGSRGESKVKK